MALAKAVLQAIDNMSGPVARATTSIRGKLGPALEQAKTRADKARVSTRLFGSTLHGIGGMASRVGGLLSGLFAGASIAGIVGMTKSFVDSTDELAKFSRAASVSTTQLQQYRYAASIVGVSQSELNTGFQQLNKNLGLAKAGTGPLVSLLKTASPELLTMLKGADGTADAMMIMVKAMHATTDPAKRAALAQAAFGRGAFKLQLLAGGGAKGLQEMMDKAERFGLISTQTAAEAERVADSFTDFGMATSGLRNALADKLLPKLAPIVEKLTDFIVANRGIIATGIDRFFSRVGRFVEFIDFGPLVLFAGSLVDGFSALSGASKFLWNSITGLVSVMMRHLAPVLSGVFSVARSVFGILQGPLSFAFRLVSSVVKVAASVFSRVLLPVLKVAVEWVGKLTSWLGDTWLGAALKNTVVYIENFADSFDGNLVAMMEAGKQFEQWIINGLADSMLWIVNTVVDSWGKMKSFAKDTFNAISEYISTMIRKIEPYAKILASVLSPVLSTANAALGRAFPGSPSVAGMRPAFAGAPAPAFSYASLASPRLIGGLNGSTLNGEIKISVSSDNGTTATVTRADVRGNGTEVKLRADTGRRRGL